MPFKDPSFTIGIEEEYLLVDRETRDLASDPPEAMMTECQERISDLVRPEFMRSQIEVGTSVCHTIQDARDELAWLRRTVADVAAEHGMAPIAASTHPFSEWMEQKHTDKERYNFLAEDMQALARRLLICGMHVHVGIDDDELRIDLMNQACYFLPHLLALSTSSPFWRGQNTGLRSYRIAVFDELPRTGLPERFDSFGEYQRHVNVMVKAGLIKDASMLWWDIRPSLKFPTIEMRISDMCTRLPDTVAIAALFVSILRMLYRLRRKNQRWRTYAALLINENRWRAQRYGLEKGLVDFGAGRVKESSPLLEELIDLILDDAVEAGCLREIEHARTIISKGTSADRQIEIYTAALADGADEHEALKAVVDWMIAETVKGT